MDLTKSKKPIHFTCPKCKTDFQFNGGDVVARKNELQQEMGIIKAKMINHKNLYGKDRYYHKLVKELEDKTNQYRLAKQSVQIASEQSEIHLFILFRKACRNKFGNDVIDKILRECEEELSFYNYDMAIQKHTNFDGV